jgi:GT2 family glycosyltransferase
MDVSIVIINYNTFDLTCDCIKSVIEHTKCKYEIILVDNASTEKDPALFAGRFPSIKLVKSDKNLGFSKGNNLGIEHATGEYILLLNSDTVLLNDAVDITLRRIKSDNKLGVVAAQLLNPDRTVQPTSCEQIRIRKLLGTTFKLHVLFKYFKPLSPDPNNEHYTDWVWGAYMLIPRTVLAKFPGGKLQDTFFMYVEDIQWCYTIKKLGYKILYMPQAQVLHYGSASSDFAGQEKHRKYILPNEYEFLKIERGNMYAYLHFMTIGLFYASNFRFDLAKFYFRFSKEQFKRHKKIALASR